MASPRKRALRKQAALGRWLERFSMRTTEWTGSSPAFGIAVVVIIVWALTGPVFHYSDAWQLVVNTATNIVTLLMVFLIQRAQNKESKAVQLKLNELVAAMQGASNRLIDVESLSEEELRVLREHYSELVKLAARDRDLLKSHSIEEAQQRHESKQPKKPERTTRTP